MTVRRRNDGFTMLELLLAIAIVAMVTALAVPSSIGFYESIQRREAVRSALRIFNGAREQALSSGRYQDVMVRPQTNRIWSSRDSQTLSSALQLKVHGAAELNFSDTGVIRFYPDGSSSGGGIDIARAGGSGTRISVDWLMGRVEQQTL